MFFCHFVIFLLFEKIYRYTGVVQTREKMRKNNKKKKMYLYRTAKTHLHAGEEVNTRALEADELGGEQKKKEKWGKPERKDEN